MPRRRLYAPLQVLLNNRLVGRLTKETSGAVEFRYEDAWLTWEHAFPVSLSLPLREDPYRGQPVQAVFENLLPDSDALRRRVAEKVGAEGFDAFSLLSCIGRDCVGALQFLPENYSGATDSKDLNGESVTEAGIERILNNLSQAPLGLTRDDDFRISVAGAQEKTALLWHGGQWLKPHGITPTTHIFKKQIGRLPNGMDLSNSVENEFYCLKLAEECGLLVNKATIHTFGETKALVVERFDRQWTSDGRLLRLPQEDCCQALSIPPGRKYQSEGGPGMVEILGLLQSADDPARDQKTFLKTQILFALLGATDGHAKNFSIFLGPGGRFRLTPLYDIVSAQPSLDRSQIVRKEMKLAMFVGKSRHYRLDEIHGRHFIQTAARANMPGSIAQEALDEITSVIEQALSRIETHLPTGFSEAIHASVRGGILSRLAQLGKAS